MDPLSATSLVLQIGALVAKVYAYGQQVKDAKKEIRELLVEILALKAVLEQFETIQDASSLRNDSGQVYSTGNSGHRDFRLLAKTRGRYNVI